MPASVGKGQRGCRNEAQRALHPEPHCDASRLGLMNLAASLDTRLHGAAASLSPKEMTMARRDTNGTANGSGGAASGRSASEHGFRADVVSLRRQRRLCRAASGVLSARSGLARPILAGILRRARTTTAPRSQSGAGTALESSASRPAAASDELISALDGNWAESQDADRRQAQGEGRGRALCSPRTDLLRATRDSVRALMMIRAYRMRGHLHANLDPLGLEPPKDHEELHPAAYGFTEADYTRQDLHRWRARASNSRPSPRC